MTSTQKIWTVLVAVGLTVPALVGAPAPAQAQAGRQAMQQCVTRVLTGLARQRASENQVASAVLTRCDRPLRTSLAQAIRSGEAPNCTVESCIDQARSRAAAEAIGVYRQRFQRR